MRYSTLAAAFIALFAVSAAASAQQAPAGAKLATGQWSGSVTPPHAEKAIVKYDVAYAGDTLKITINAGEHGTFEATEAAFDGEKITFKFRPGPEVLCVLRKKDLDYTGACTEEDGSAADIIMTPPAPQPAKK